MWQAMIGPVGINAQVREERPGSLPSGMRPAYLPDAISSARRPGAERSSRGTVPVLASCGSCPRQRQMRTVQTEHPRAAARSG